MVRLGIVGGTAIYHALAFSGLINGVAPGQTRPDNWPKFPRCIEDARITVVWDENQDNACKLAEVFGIDMVAQSHEEVVANCDGVIIADDVTRNHCRHARPYLEASVPTFIDKPLAPDAATAAELLELAARHNAPLMSGSALRYAAETEELRANPGKLGDINLTTAVGPKELFFYGIHPMELAHSILGGGIATVQNIGDENQDVVKVTYKNGRILMLLVSRAIGSGFEIMLYGTQGRERISVTDSTTFYAQQLHLIAQMAREKKAPVPIENAYEVIRVLEAGKKSFAEGGAVITL